MFSTNRIFIITLTVTLASSQLISFDEGGNIGVNFAGFRASAGLGGLLTGDLTKGGLHAEAGTPFGQAARAGLGGMIGQEGAAAGGLYAGATAGNGVAAVAGLEGASTANGGVGRSAAGAMAGGVYKGVEKTSIHGPASSLRIEKAIETVPAQPVLVEKTVETVPVQPVLVQKTVVRHPHRWNKFVRAHLETQVNTVPEAPQTINVVERTYVKPLPPPVIVHKQISTAPAHGGFLGGLFAGIGASAGAGAAGGAVHEVSAIAPASKSVTHTTHLRSEGLFNDIFNIPIATLQAVNKLVNGVTGGGTVAVSKTAHVHY